MPELVFFRRGDEVLRLPLAGGKVVLGRGEGSDVVLPDPEVSRQQASIEVRDSAAHLRDLSGKGTWVLGQSVAQTELADGADITLGQWRAVFRLRAAADGAAETFVGAERTSVQAPAEADRWQAAQVRVRHGGGQEVVEFVGESLVVGSGPGCEVRLEDPFVSGRHLRLSRQGARFLLQDEGSTNGTFVGALRVTSAEVPLGTTIRLGSAELSLEPRSSRSEPPAFEGIIGQDGSVRALAELIERVAPSTAAVAIFGESGTGKELVARAVHARSSRRAAAFIPVNCAAISKDLIESELFGHEKGAFTGAQGVRKGAFEEADGGTIFLDEIGELPLDLQPKLLRALESGEIKRVGASRPLHVEVRIVAATNRDLLEAAREGRFREDLYYRLCVVPLHLPPLRSRRGDVAALAEHFVRTFSPRGQEVKLTSRALERLAAHPWPGNVRELRNVIHRALLLRRGTLIDGDDLSFDVQPSPEVGVPVPDVSGGLTLEQMLLKVERQIVERALQRFGNNKERVARELGVARSTLFKRLKEWGLTRQDEAE